MVDIGFSFITITEKFISENTGLNKTLKSYDLYNPPKGITLTEDTSLDTFKTLFSLAEWLSGYKLGHTVKQGREFPAWCTIKFTEKMVEWLFVTRKPINYYFTLLKANYSQSKNISQSILESNKLDLLFTSDDKLKDVFPYVAKQNFIYSIDKKQMERISKLLGQKSLLSIEKLNRVKNTRLGRKYSSVQNFSSFLLVSKMTGIELCHKNLLSTNDPLLLSALTSACFNHLHVHPTGTKSISQKNARGTIKKIKQSAGLFLSGIEVHISDKKFSFLVIENDFLIAIIKDPQKAIPYKKWKQKLDNILKTIKEENIDFLHSNLKNDRILEISVEEFSKRN